MASAGKQQLVRFKHKKTQFEVATQPGSVLKFRDGKGAWPGDVLVAELVFTNFAKGLRAGDEELKEAFGTVDPVAAAKVIVEKGELQVSAAERQEAMDKKKREIVHFLNRNFVDPKSGLPHPVVRIEGAMETSKFRFDAESDAKEQAMELIKKLQGVLTFKKAEMEITLVIPAKWLGSANNVVHKHGSVLREKQTPEGFVFDIGIVPGEFDTLIEALNKVTKGDFKFTLNNGVAPAAEAKAVHQSKPHKKGEHVHHNKEKEKEHDKAKHHHKDKRGPAAASAASAAAPAQAVASPPEEDD